VAFSPQANYTDWATATCRRNLVPTFVNRGVSRGQHVGTPTAVNLFSKTESLLFFQLSPHLYTQGLSRSRSRPTATQKIWQRRESNPGPLGLQSGSLISRPQRRSYVYYIAYTIAYSVLVVLGKSNCDYTPLCCWLVWISLPVRQDSSSAKVICSGRPKIMQNELRTMSWFSACIWQGRGVLVPQPCRSLLWFEQYNRESTIATISTADLEIEYPDEVHLQL
jgi:hypothetical protein